MPRSLPLMPARIGVAAFALATTLGLAAVRADDNDARLRGVVDAAIRPLMAEHDIPGMAVAVTAGGRSAVFTYGVASREANKPVEAGTLFEIGSVSKTFTATLAAYALALGKLSLDDHPSRYLRELQGSAIDRATLLHFGTYTAGRLPLQFPGEVAGTAQMIPYFRQWRPDAAPGAQRRYSNPSIGLFGHLAGRALGRDFGTVMETEIFPRLGLRNSHIRVPQNALGTYAWGYGQANRPIRVNPGLFGAEAYGVKTTAGDMIRFVEANIDPSRLEEPMRRAVETTHLGFFRTSDMVQGLGWEQYAYPVTLERLLAGNARALSVDPATAISPPQVPAGPTLFNKTGSTNGFGAYAVFVPARRIGMVMLMNRNAPIPARIRAAYAILERLGETSRQ